MSPFAFQSFSFKRPYHQPLPEPISSRRMIPEGVALMAREDIYSYGVDREKPVLLIRGGQAVGEELLKKLMRYGAVPSQFIMSEDCDDPPVLEAVREILDLQPDRQVSAASLPEEAPPHQQGMNLPATMRRTRRMFRDKILILDTDDKSIRRLTDCLMACGFSLSDIHIVRVAEHLVWAIEKYQPTVLFVDFQLNRRQSGLSLLASLQSLPPVQRDRLKQMVLTIDLPSNQNKMRDQVVAEALALGAKPVFKPLNRFVLNHVFQ